MAAGNISQALGTMQEYVRPELPELFPLGLSRLMKRIKTRTDVKAVSNRPTRIPFQVQQGGVFASDQGGFNGGDMGTGTGPTTTYGQLSCTSFRYCASYTAGADYNTDTDEKAIESYVKLTHSQALNCVGQYLDAIVQGNGSNTLDTVVSTSGQEVVVNIANQFQAQQPVDVWSALGGTFRGTFYVQTVDQPNNAIWSSTPLPAGITAGDLLLVNGSAGIANSGLAGIQSYQVSGNTGSYMGIQRSTFPGEFSTPSITVNSTLTPAVARAIEIQVQTAIGIEKADQSGIIAHCNLDMQQAWELNSLNPQFVPVTETKRGESNDMLPRKPPPSIAGREMLTNEHGTLGRIDFLGLQYWFRIESKPLDLYDVGGQTLFPGYGLSGGLESLMMFYYVMSLQIGNEMPRAGSYLTGLTIPKYLFGH